MATTPKMLAVAMEHVVESAECRDAASQLVVDALVKQLGDTSPAHVSVLRSAAATSLTPAFETLRSEQREHSESHPAPTIAALVPEPSSVDDTSSLASTHRRVEALIAPIAPEGQSDSAIKVCRWWKRVGDA
jgi:hypothetical protein